MINNNITAIRKNLIAEIERRVNDKILERTNADLLIKLINNADLSQTRNAIGEKNLSRAALPIVYDTKIHFFQKLDFFHPKTDVCFIRIETTELFGFQYPFTVACIGR